MATHLILTCSDSLAVNQPFENCLTSNRTWTEIVIEEPLNPDFIIADNIGTYGITFGAFFTLVATFYVIAMPIRTILKFLK